MSDASSSNEFDLPIYLSDETVWHKNSCTQYHSHGHSTARSISASYWILTRQAIISYQLSFRSNLGLGCARRSTLRLRGWGRLRLFGAEGYLWGWICCFSLSDSFLSFWNRFGVCRSGRGTVFGEWEAVQLYLQLSAVVKLIPHCCYSSTVLIGDTRVEASEMRRVIFLC
jgi:hypothetical protein